MRIRDYRRWSTALTLVFAGVLVIGAILLVIGNPYAPVALIIGVAGVIVASSAIRLYGRMSMESALMNRKKPEE